MDKDQSMYEVITKVTSKDASKTIGLFVGAASGGSDVGTPERYKCRRRGTSHRNLIIWMRSRFAAQQPTKSAESRLRRSSGEAARVACLITSMMLILMLAVLFNSPMYAAAHPSANHSDDERMIRDQADRFTKAFAQGDASTIGDMWTQDATLVTAYGVEIHGREAIQNSYARLFAANGAQPLVVSIESIRFPSSNVAIEEGMTHLLKEQSPEVGSRYTAVHCKDNGRWRMCNVTETAYAAASTTDYLNGLSWLIGDWVAVSGNDKVHFNARWVADKHFILCTYRTDGTPTARVSDAEMIGWDPIRHCLFTSSFGSTGGFGRGVVVAEGDNWVVKSHAVQPDGSRANACYIFHPADKDTFTWQSRERTLNGVPLPDTNVLKIVRAAVTDKQ